MESVGSSETTIIDEEQVQEQNRGADEGNNRSVAIRGDDYQWKKYGQKYIITSQKNRSYFKCGKKNCEARKKVEWPPNEPNNIVITYVGEHNHRDNEEDGISDNQYDLAVQMFGSRT